MRGSFKRCDKDSLGREGLYEDETDIDLRGILDPRAIAGEHCRFREVAMKICGRFALMLLAAACVTGCGSEVGVKAAAGNNDSLVGDRAPDQIYISTVSKRAIVIRRAGARSVHFTILDGATPSSKVLEGVATLVNEGLDPDTGADIDGTAYPLDTYLYSEPQCYLEIGVGQSPQFDFNLEVNSCACKGGGTQLCPLDGGALYIRQDGAGGL